MKLPSVFDRKSFHYTPAVLGFLYEGIFKKFVENAC